MAKSYDLRREVEVANMQTLIDAVGNINITVGNLADKLLQVDSVGTTTYLGYADAGSLTSAPLWAIKKIDEVGADVSITWADGNTNFDNIWDNRLSLTYA
jgi:hypothetical protein